MEEINKIYKQIIEKAKNRTGTYDIESTTRKMIKEALLIQRKSFLDIIDKELKYQKKYITGNFDKDKPIKWRIEGYKVLKDKLK